jgi:lysozyme
MKTSINGLNLITSNEGLILHPYLDVAGVPTIGYGTTFYPGGKRVTMKDKPITKDQAISFLQNALTSFENDINHFVRSKINQNQFDALADFTYNEGSGHLKSSTLLQKVNANPNDPTITHEFLKWVYADGKVCVDLVHRRTQESNLYFKPM